MPHDLFEFGIESWRFRPVRDTSIEQFEALLNPTPEARRHYLDELAENAREELTSRGFGLWD